ncbi:MAG: zf-HC2 domain-containing protein [Geodermatophilaceae bacterium]|nr:zf-HC2 domain-containing protein [Geodermatophilaceae bacterium]
MSLTPTDFHLALEAVVAYVDGELSPGAQTRAVAHLNACVQCSFDVAAQREAKTALIGAGGPDLPSSLLARLQKIPFTTDLQTSGMTLAMHGEHLHWSRFDSGSEQPGSFPSSPAPPDRRPPSRGDAVTRPDSRRKRLSASRLRRLRRGLMGAVAGLTVGVLAVSVAPVAATVGTASGAATSQNRAVPNDRNPEVASALVGSMDDAIAPRRFSGAATGLP